ncbi:MULTISPECIES: D-amino acid dehydrogenase [Silvimonas]|uniref:D-amino acid dehydrogenase n=1 Tax=Silvimonas TaxID=300264 RepID=UPI0024B37D70|nr:MULTISPECIES: D-amino acid dehydrogenase [Silvimonas]MDR3428942.1 D-amino acid dehydrogenase [Silvimonas sp.]
MHVVVLGAGIAGVTSAWFLHKAGHEVTVIDREPDAALQTSFANGGQISVCHAEPWANPKAPWKVLQWLAEEDAPLLFRPKADWAQWRWGLRFLQECTPARARHNLQNLVRLGLYSRAQLQQLRHDTGLHYDELTKGILHYYTDEAEFAAAVPAAALMRQVGLDRQVKSAQECLAIEPALASSLRPIVGGTYTPSDESGDAHKFTHHLAQLAAQAGVVFRYGTQIDYLEDAQSCEISGVQLRWQEADGYPRTELLQADAYLVCLGSFSPQLLKPLKITLDIYPAKGYSATIPVRPGDIAPEVSLTDDGHKLVFSRLGDRLRVAGTAELNGYDLTLNPVRCAALIHRTREIFPHAGDYDNATFWSGLRPTTPGNLPYIGGTRYPNLFINSGHGTLGWTEGCGAGKAVADIISGHQPEVDFPFCSGL